MPPRPPVSFNAIPILAPLTAEDRAALSPLCELRAYEKDGLVDTERDGFLIRRIETLRDLAPSD